MKMNMAQNLIIKKLVCEVGSFFYKDDISFIHFIGMVNCLPYFFAGTYKCEVVIV